MPRKTKPKPKFLIPSNATMDEVLVAVRDWANAMSDRRFYLYMNCGQSAAHANKMSREDMCRASVSIQYAIFKSLERESAEHEKDTDKEE